MSAKDLLKDKDRKFRLLFEDHPQPMWVTDPESGSFLEVNGAATRLYGYTAEQFRNMNIRDVAAENRHNLPCFWTLPAEGTWRTNSGRPSEWKLWACSPAVSRTTSTIC